MSEPILAMFPKVGIIGKVGVWRYRRVGIVGNVRVQKYQGLVMLAGLEHEDTDVLVMSGRLVTVRTPHPRNIPKAQ